MESAEKTLTAADKTSNMYRLDKTEYDKLLHNAVTTTYKKANQNLSKKINKEGKRFAKDVNVLDRIEVNDCFITLKDHKENVNNKPTTRLIKPAKNEIGRISKVALDKIKKEFCKKTNVTQWKNMADVVNGSKLLKSKKHLNVVCLISKTSIHQ